MSQIYSFDDVRKMSDEQVLNPVKKLRLLSSSTLKLIAIVSMLIDHVGAAILENIMYYNYYDLSVEVYNNLVYVDNILRSIGRIAFPIFCFLLVEGFFKTRNVKKYMRNLLIFSIVSEVPFDLAFSRTLISWNHQNVFFTLFLGISALAILNWSLTLYKNKKIGLVIYSVLSVIAVVASMALAFYMRTDYNAIGVAIIIILYAFRKNRYVQSVLGAASFTWEMPAPFAFIPIILYNGKRGLNLKYFFYAFYPVHLLILYYIASQYIIA